MSHDQYWGTLWKHRFIISSDVYAVVGFASDDRYLLAWKCQRRTNGRIQHPGFTWALSRHDERLFVKHSNGMSADTIVSLENLIQLTEDNWHDLGTDM